MSWREDRSGSGAVRRPCRFCFLNINHVTIPRRFEPLSCSLKRLRASMEMSNFERKYSLVYLRIISIGKTKPTSEKDLLIECLSERRF